MTGINLAYTDFVYIWTNTSIFYGLIEKSLCVYNKWIYLTVQLICLVMFTTNVGNGLYKIEEM
jgi:hypothetical protein